VAAADPVLTCQCDNDEFGTCGAEITQEDLLCDTCRSVRKTPGNTCLSISLGCCGPATLPHVALLLDGPLRIGGPEGLQATAGGQVIVFPLIKRIFHSFLRDPQTQYAMNKWLMYFWLANMIIVHLVFFLAPRIWQEISILYLADISVYACIGQHYTGMAASLTGLKADERAGDDLADNDPHGDT
jgi:hypothetical protein